MQFYVSTITWPVVANARQKVWTDPKFAHDWKRLRWSSQFDRSVKLGASPDTWACEQFTGFEATVCASAGENAMQFLNHTDTKVGKNVLIRLNVTAYLMHVQLAPNSATVFFFYSTAPRIHCEMSLHWCQQVTQCKRLLKRQRTCAGNSSTRHSKIHEEGWYQKKQNKKWTLTEE